MIQTPEGERPIESLQTGDLVLTPEGAVPVKFLARTSRGVKTLLAMGKMPIRIATGALEAQIPSRDTDLSPSHGICLDGHLVEAGALLNGSTIHQHMDWSEGVITYYNIELECHHLIWANGLQAESYFANYRNNGFSRESWDNYSQYLDLYGTSELMEELDLPRIPFARQLPAALQLKLKSLESVAV